MTPSDKANRQFWTLRRHERPSPPIRLSVSEFVMEANRRLCADKANIEGTRFIVIQRAGCQDLPSWEGPEAMRPLIQRIFQNMTTRFQLPVAFRIDRE